MSENLKDFYYDHEVGDEYCCDHKTVDEAWYPSFTEYFLNDYSAGSSSTSMEDQKPSIFSTSGDLQEPDLLNNKKKKDLKNPNYEDASTNSNNKLDEEGKSKKKLGDKKQKEARFAFMTKSEVDHLEDGYRWRKYGQKAVKNSPYPRSYYRCTTQKCLVKKRVERSYEEPSIVITTYEGQHNHQIPTNLRGNVFAHHQPNINHVYDHHQYHINNTDYGLLQDMIIPSLLFPKQEHPSRGSHSN